MAARRGRENARLRVGLDTSCLIPLLSEWHQFHDRTVQSVSAVPPDSLVICSHALLECFSVLTRLPPPYRIPPEKAKLAIETSFAQVGTVCGVEANEAWAAITRTTELRFGGGKVYDAVIAESTARAGAAVLLTWNVADFRSVAPPGLEIREP